MNERAALDIQDSFFAALRQSGALIEVVLINGENRLGHLRRFDKFVIVLETAGREELLYKHAIACIRAESHSVAPGGTAGHP